MEPMPERRYEPSEPAGRRVHRLSLWTWPLLLLFWLAGGGWMALNSLACWSEHLQSAWACELPFALPLVLLAIVAVVFGFVIATLHDAGMSRSAPGEGRARRVRRGYRALQPAERAQVRRSAFGLLTALGWTAAALAYNYLGLTLLAWLLGAVVMALALLLNRLWLGEQAEPADSFGIAVPPHARWPVAWYNPVTLFQAAREWASSVDMVRNADPRDPFARRFAAIDLAHAGNADGGFWFDFISDTGDGGNATYTVARAALADALGGPDEQGRLHETPRGRLLLLGGDLAYPGASNIEYARRFFELFEAARPRSGDERQRHTVLAIPQNHDWFDSASTFRRYFVNRNRGEFIGADTPQEGSYFATRLPNGWWVLGLDFALGHDIDRGQLEAFRRLIGKDTFPDEDPPKLPMPPGADLILVYPEPYWTCPIEPHATKAYPLRYQRLEADLLEAGMHVRLRLAGDLHHYVREWREGDERQLVTCGTGGAFLHPTHAREVRAPKAFRLLCNDEAIDPDFRRVQRVGTVDALESAALDQRRDYPPPDTSRALAWRNVWALFKLGNNRLPGFGGAGWLRGNIAFVAVLGLLYWVAGYTQSMVFSPSFAQDGFLPIARVGDMPFGDFLWDWLRALFYSPLALGVTGLLLALCIALAKDEPSHWVRVAFPALHFACHFIAAATLYWWLAGAVETAWAALMLDRCTGNCHWTSTALARGALMFGAGGVLGGLILGTYLALMARFGWLTNNAFSPLAVEDYKGFLRFHIDAAGTLHGRFFACDRVPRRWVRREPPEQGSAGDARPAWVEADPRERACWRVADSFSLSRTPPAG